MNVLVIDDDQRVIDLVSRALKSQNFVTESATTREDGFEKAKSKKYDVIILDVMLADGDKNGGFELLSQLRALGIFTPILILSSRTLIEDRVHGLDSGADDYLIKNFSTAELVARVKALMRRKPTERSNFIKCGNLTVNLSDLVVTRAGKRLKLTKKEFAILVALMRKKNTVVTRDEIIETVWGDTKRVSTNSVDVHIRYLRKIIDEGYKVQLIRTVHGYGYSISSTNTPQPAEEKEKEKELKKKKQDKDKNKNKDKKSKK